MNKSNYKSFKRNQNLLNGNKIGNAMKIINKEIVQFIKNIMTDCDVNTDIIYYKLEFKDMCYKILLFNSETGTIAGKAWSLTEFLELCSNKKIEFEINIIVRKLLIKLEEPKSTNTHGTTLPIWI